MGIHRKKNILTEVHEVKKVEMGFTHFFRRIIKTSLKYILDYSKFNII
jgi:hypothetical protein